MLRIKRTDKRTNESVRKQAGRHVTIDDLTHIYRTTSERTKKRSRHDEVVTVKAPFIEHLVNAQPGSSGWVSGDERR